MIREEIKGLDTSPASLRKFGLVVGGVFALLSLWWWWRQNPLYCLLAGPAAALVFLGVVYPKGLRLVFVGWMTMAFVLGLVVSTMLLTLFFFLVVTPIGFLTRIMGKDFLTRRASEAKSYWIRRDVAPATQKSDYEQQF